jgi:hypothetical protein
MYAIFVTERHGFAKKSNCYVHLLPIFHGTKGFFLSSPEFAAERNSIAWGDVREWDLDQRPRWILASGADAGFGPLGRQNSAMKAMSVCLWWNTTSE